jgi:hypothetical protein
LFFDKKNEKTLSESMKEKFHTFCGQCGLDVASICDPMVRFVMQALACNILRKCIKYQVPTTVIAATERCVEGVQMNWEMFLLNQFLIDCEEAQYKGFEFHYSWLLILITLSSWREPDDSQFLGVKEKPFLVVWYQNLWYTDT